jgi:hypothetical protein
MTPSPADIPAPASPTAEPPVNECRLIGSFAILVQLALGALALLSLVYKRWRERPQRPVKIWFFDVSKQVFGSVLVHAANVFMSLLTSGRFAIAIDPVVVAGQVRMVRRAVEMVGLGAVVLGARGEEAAAEAGEYVPNPCSFYLLNLGIDVSSGFSGGVGGDDYADCSLQTTLGIPILIIIVRVLTRLVAFTPIGNPPESIQSGNYGTPPNAWWWFKQSIIYFCGLMGMKFCLLNLFKTLPWLPHIGDWSMGWTEGNAKLQIVFVMMLFPLCMNALQYYIIDSYIKKQESPDGEGVAVLGDDVVYDELAVSGTDDSDDEADEDPRKSISRGDSHLRLATRDAPTGRVSRDLEYDPAVDGDSQTVIGSSASRVSKRGALPKELLPHE